MTEDEMVGWHYQLNGCEFQQTLGNNEGQGSLACCIPCGHKELDMFSDNNNRIVQIYVIICNVLFDCLKCQSWAR